MSVPQLNTKNLHAQLDRLANRGRFVDRQSVEYRSLEREIQKVIKAPGAAADGYGLMGALSSIAGDVEGVRENYRKALLLRQDPVIRGNRAISLMNVGQFREAAEDASYLERPELGNLEVAIKLNIELARFRHAIKLMNKRNELNNEKPNELGVFPKIVEILDRAKISDDAFLPALDIIGGILRSFRIIVFTEPLVNVVNDDGVDAILFRFGVPASPQETVDLETKAIDALFSSGLEIHQSIIRYGFLAHSETALNAA